MIFNNHILLMACGAILIGLSPIMAKAVSIHASSIAVYRFGIGSIAMGVFLFFSKNKIHWPSFKRILPYLCGAGLFFALDLWVWHHSIVYIGAGIATLLANTQVFYLVALSMILFGEKPHWYFFISMIVAFVGLGMASLPFLKFEGIDTNFLGVLYGLLTGLSYAVVTLFLKKAIDLYEGKGPWPVFGVTFVSAFFSLLFALFENKLQMASPRDWGFMIVYGAGIHFLGWIFITRALAFIPLSLASLLLLLQPIFATFFGAVIFNEHLSLIQMVGLVLGLSGIYGASVSRSKAILKKDPKIKANV